MSAGKGGRKHVDRYLWARKHRASHYSPPPLPHPPSLLHLLLLYCQQAAVTPCSFTLPLPLSQTAPCSSNLLTPESSPISSAKRSLLFSFCFLTAFLLARGKPSAPPDPSCPAWEPQELLEAWGLGQRAESGLCLHRDIALPTVICADFAHGHIF